MPEVRKLRIGIVGLGIGMRHASSFAQVPLVEIVAMADPAPNRLGTTVEEFCAHYGAKPYADGYEMMEKERLDAVAICSNPKLHLPLVQAAARKGLHILMEKPMAGTVEDCEGIIEACRRAGVQLHMEFPMRQLAPMVELKRVLDAGTLGRPFMVNCDYVSGLRTPNHWIWVMGDGSSPVNENTCHGIDSVRYILGDVDRIYAEADNFIGQGPNEVADAAAFTMHHKGGGISTLVGGACATGEMDTPIRMSVFCTEGQATVDGLHHTFSRLKWARRGGETWEHDWGDAPSLRSMMGQPYARYPLLEPSLKNFVENLLSGKPAAATADDGRENVQICLAVLESARTHQPVDIRQPVLR
ncbi:MAG: Gfo/Idh/MocA family oxidoreductase [Chloroflexota bacterium]|nr:MAG: Gfo/Idh/MocA family oxidoreductase [Chloroflexota bacterium]